MKTQIFKDSGSRGSTNQTGGEIVESSINRYSVGDRTPGLVYGDDGSLTIHMSHREPKDPDARANWLPAPDGPFYVLIRHYSPQSPILTGDWLPKGIEKK